MGFDWRGDGHGGSVAVRGGAECSVHPRYMIYTADESGEFDGDFECEAPGGLSAEEAAAYAAVLFRSGRFPFMADAEPAFERVGDVLVWEGGGGRSLAIEEMWVAFRDDDQVGGLFGDEDEAKAALEEVA